jgi:hypothetical protein
MLAKPGKPGIRVSDTRFVWFLETLNVIEIEMLL